MIEADSWFQKMRARHERDPKYWVEYLKLVFSEDVGRLMDDQDVSQAELARKLDVSRAYITRLFRGTFNPTLETLAKVALALNARVAVHLHPMQTTACWSDLPVWSRALTAYTQAVERPTERWSEKPVFSGMAVSTEVQSEFTTNSAAA
jgi:transcriptional regulator with XRE-family HTH domain